MDQQRELLDKLFGPDRNLPSSQQNKTKRNFFDKEVCKYFLASLCPYYELFKNTKSDLGPCKSKFHDTRLKEEYNALSDDEKNRFGYERDLVRKLKELVREMDRKIAKNKQRADEENKPKIMSEDQQKMIHDLTKNMNLLAESSETLGELGKVDQSLQNAQEFEKTKLERELLEQRFKYPCGRIMFVCDVCGVFINSTDNEARRADHYNGKQYLGWKVIREKLSKLDDKLARDEALNAEFKLKKRMSRSSHRNNNYKRPIFM